MTPATALTAPAPAKVNLGLAVLTRRGDGFHEVETLMARLALADEVRLDLEPGGEAGVRLTVSGEVPGGEGLPADERNLAHRAARAYLEAYAAARRLQPAALPGVRLELVKRVPVAAGLGGGSSDAAAVLGLLARALPVGDADAALDLERLALELGSDVPFFLSGHPAAVARGRGERLTPFELPELHLVLVNPGLALAAADAYRELVGYTPRLRPERALERLARGTDPGWSNGLQPGVLRRHPELRQVLGALREAGLTGVLMSGSGSTCFGVAVDAAAAARAAEALAASQPGWWTVATRTSTGAG